MNELTSIEWKLIYLSLCNRRNDIFEKGIEIKQYDQLILKVENKIKHLNKDDSENC